jgi:WD40 repeat protein
MNESGAISVWDIASGSPEPRVIEIDSAISGNAIVEFSPDLTRYRHNDGLRYTVRDTATHEPLGDYRGDRVKLSPDWSLVAYWNGGMLVVDDLETGQRREFDLLPGYLGEVADFDALSGNVIFEAERFTVTNIASAGKDILTSFDEAIYIEDAQFFDSGNCVVSIEYNGVLAFHETNSGVDCGDDGRMIKNYSEAFAVSPQGRYIVGYTIDCYTPYSYVVSRVYPLKGQSEAELPSQLEYYYACGRYTFAFPSDESAIYFADGLLWRGQFSEDGSLDQSQNVKRLLRYSNDNIDDEPTEYSNARIVGVFLGPDEQTIAVYIEDSKGADYVQERYIEIFALHDLGPGVLRRDVHPLRTIPDATFATFSPDSRYVVTNNGLYSVGGADEISAIRGGISAFSPDSQTLATYQDGFVTLWRVSQPQPTDLPLAQYDIRGVRELAFSADGTRLFVVRAGEVQTWGVAP